MLSRAKTEAACRRIRLRFVDLVPELRKFGLGKTTVVVVVEALDEVQRSVLGVMQFVAQDRHRLVERDISLAAETAQTTRHLNASLHCVHSVVDRQITASVKDATIYICNCLLSNLPARGNWTFRPLDVLYFVFVQFSLQR